MKAWLILFGAMCFVAFPSQGIAQVAVPVNQDRSFEKFREQVAHDFEGKPVKGNHKRAKRALHYWERRLDSEGRMFNHVLANMEALEQLYIDTFPAVIQGDWQNVGPLTTIGTDFNQEGVGRINQIHFASANIWYVGTAGGGLWRTDVGGIHVGGPYPWYPMTDSLPSISISGIVTHPNNVDDVYILTGDGESMSYAIRGTQPGIGILHSTDGGITWETTGFQYTMPQVQAGYKLIRYPGSIDTMFAACTDGLHRTTNGWSSNSTPIIPRCYDIEFKPDDPQTIYAACLGSLRRSTNGGVTFSNITANLVQTNLNSGNMGRMAIAVTPANAEYLYVIIASSENDNEGLLSFQYSTDGGETFIETIDNSYNILAGNDPTTETDGQGDYDLAIWADPGNAQTVIVGGVNLWKTGSSGLFWVELVNWTNEPPEYTHADIHAIETNPFTGDIVVGTDGGLYSSDDGGFEWLNRSHGLGITQYYHLDVFTDFLGFPFITGGAQDNGTSVGYGFNDAVFEMIGGGDGFRSYQGVVDGTHSRYRSSQMGRLFAQFYTVDIWFENEITPEDELDGSDGLGAWDTPYQPNPNNFNELLAGYGELYYSVDGGEDWFVIDYPDGIAYDNSRLITQIEWHELNGNNLFFYVSDATQRHLYKCETFILSAITQTLEVGTCTIQDLDTIPIMPQNGDASDQPTDIAVSGLNTDEVWLSFAGYSATTKVYYNPDVSSGAPWVNITYNLPNTPVHCLAWDTDGLYAGSDIGTFYLPHGQGEWIYFSKGLPTVAVTEIEVRSTVLGKKIFASTWGRGIWYSSPPVPIRRTRWYVDDSATGLESGESWEHALTTLQTALDTILPSDSIWVASGTYYPESINGFHLNYPNIYIWGGFNATEDSIAQRDFDLNPTILSGDIGVLNDSLDNANHVFLFGGHNGNVLLDGFHITEGFAKDPGEHSNGGGIYYSTTIQSGKPIISNCRIYNNTALGGSGLSGYVGYGAGMYIADYVSGDPAMYVRKCRFENNYSLNRGGGLCIDVARTNFPQDTGTAVVYLDSCVFVNNTAHSEGGGMYIEAIRGGIVKLFIDSGEFNDNELMSNLGTGGGIGGDVTPGGGTIQMECSNTDFSNHVINETNSDGGAIYLDGTGGTIEATFTDCAFTDNHASEGSAIFNLSSGAAAVSKYTFSDCQFTDNGGAAGGALYFYSPARGHTEVNFTECFLNNNSATGRGGAIFYNGDNGGRIVSTINTSIFTNHSANENGAIRFFIRKGSSPYLGTGDLTILNSFFAQNSATGSGAGGAIGIYSEVGIVESNMSNTNFIDNSTGARGGAVAHEHIASDSSAIVAFYTDCDFIGNSVSVANGNGGALAFNKTNAVVDQCVFENNFAKHGGAVYNTTGLYDDEYTQEFNDCQFIANAGIDRGGALYIRHDDPSVMGLEINSCVLDSNYTTGVAGSGGAIYTHGEGRAIQTISTSAFVDNKALSDGGAMYINRATGAAVTDTLFMFVNDCFFFNNDAGTTGETVDQFCNSSAIISQWTNTDFYNNEPSVMFLNRRSLTHLSRATFIDCNFFYYGEPPPAPASPYSPNPAFMDATED